MYHNYNYEQVSVKRINYSQGKYLEKWFLMVFLISHFCSKPYCIKYVVINITSLGNISKC